MQNLLHEGNMFRLKNLLLSLYPHGLIVFTVPVTTSAKASYAQGSDQAQKPDQYCRFWQYGLEMFGFLCSYEGHPHKAILRYQTINFPSHSQYYIQLCNAISSSSSSSSSSFSERVSCDKQILVRTAEMQMRSNETFCTAFLANVFLLFFAQHADSANQSSNENSGLRPRSIESDDV